MCLVAFNWRPRHAIPLLLVANRDEYRERPAEVMQWWSEPEVLAGRDLQAGGTWFAVDRIGRFCLVTNIRPGYLGRQGSLSRGDLPVRYLSQPGSISEFHAQIRPEIHRFGGFNLLLGDREQLFWFSSDTPEGRTVKPGIHTLCNDALDTPWPKTQLAVEQMQEATPLLEVGCYETALFSRADPFPDAVLPETGVTLGAERMLSAQTILDTQYGTRSRTWLTWHANTEVEVREAQVSCDGMLSNQRHFSWRARSYYAA